MKIAALGWDGNNIGDDIQTVAVMQHLPPVDFFLNRDHLNEYDGPECLLVMNGWFMTKPNNWPPSPKIKPIFFGFHVQENARASVARHVEYLKKHEPIGCRDSGTVDFVRSLGVEAYLSLCATLTFQPAEMREAQNLYLVEADLSRLHRDIRSKHGLKIKEASHRFIDVSPATRLQYAREVVETYRQNAAMVVTSRIHCAMPCVAMGIPVLFIGPKVFRTEILEEIGLVRHERSQDWLTRLTAPKIREWPRVLDVSELSKRVKDDLRGRIEKALQVSR